MRYYLHEKYLYKKIRHDVYDDVFLDLAVELISTAVQLVLQLYCIRFKIIKRI